MTSPGRYRLNITLRDSKTFGQLASFDRPIVVSPEAEAGAAPPLALDPIALYSEPRKGRE